MTNSKICQSCAMPMTAADHGTNADGTPSTDFCKFCMKDGKWGTAPWSRWRISAPISTCVTAVRLISRRR